MSRSRLELEFHARYADKHIELATQFAMDEQCLCVQRTGNRVGLQWLLNRAYSVNVSADDELIGSPAAR